MCDYNRSLAICMAALVLKNVLVTLGTVRERISKLSFRSMPGGSEISEDSSSKALSLLVFYIIKPMLLIGMPGGSMPGAPSAAAESQGLTRDVEGQKSSPPAPEGGMLDRWLAVHRNSVEQEPYIIALALTYKAVVAEGDHSAWAAIILYVLVACRYLHMFSYLLALQPWRTITFVIALAGSGFMAVLMLLDYAF